MTAVKQPLVRARKVSDANDMKKGYRRLPNLRSFKSWRVTVSAGVAIAVAVLFANISILVWVKLSFEQVNGTATVLDGSCETTKTATLWAGLAINILSTLLLSASNNCAQLLSAPTRRDVDRAHAKSSWMDVGVQSLRNLTKVPRWRVCIWLLLYISSVPLHLLYNSVVFDTLAANTYKAILVTEGFVNGRQANDNVTLNPLPQHSEDLSVRRQLHQNISSLQRLDNADCIQAYGSSALQSSHGSVLLVTSLNSTKNVLNTWDHGPFALDMAWIRPVKEWNLKASVREAANWAISSETRCHNLGHIGGNCPAAEAPIEYCLAQSLPAHCTVRISATILGVVIACNVVKIICLTTAVLSCGFQPLATVGDALSSFLDRPDPTTVDMPLLTFHDVDYDHHKKPHFTDLLANRPFKLQARRWGAATSGGRWCMALLLSFGVWATGLAYIFQSMHTTARGNVVYSFAELWHQGFGSINTKAVLQPTQDRPLIANVLLANAPQIAISFVYVFYNSILTCMVGEAEHARFAKVRKPLRVSKPRGAQRSTFWLQLPYRYSLPLMLSMAFLHWLIARSIFLVKIRVYDLNHVELPADSVNACGYSTMALIFAVGLGGIMIIALLGNGFRKLDLGMPIAGCCSLVLSASAQAGALERDVALQPLMYGVISDNRAGEFVKARAGFSSKKVTPLRDGVVYS